MTSAQHGTRAFDEVRLGPVLLRNRIIKSATFEGRTPHGEVTDALIQFHRAVAAGGAAMTTIAYCAVAPEGRTHREQIVLGPEQVPGLRRLTDAVHAEGAAVSLQIGHAGPVANAASNGVPAVSASRTFNALSMRFTRRATDADLERITRQFADGARIAVESGFDCIELHLGHNYLLSAFLSPKLNRRRDAWGGKAASHATLNRRREAGDGNANSDATLNQRGNEWGGGMAARARFPRQVVRAVRDAIGHRVALIAKFNMTDGVRRGLSVQDALETARLLETDGTLDALLLTAGSSLANPMYLFKGEAPVREFAATLPWHLRLPFRFVGRRFLPEYPYEEAYFLPLARHFRGALTMPLILLGGINQLDTIDLAVSEGFPLVAMGRALLREPDLVNRLRDEPSHHGLCIHCNRCMPTIYGGTHCPIAHPEGVPFVHG